LEEGYRSGRTPAGTWEHEQTERDRSAKKCYP
jgi:hypothetical protein